ncbi:MAG: hypothetical protein NTY46_01000 [Candidatus Sumerlaeota bacterium]|nr:hypothetical protein [Candidatus Sumerlaeota bacterium]
MSHKMQYCLIMAGMFVISSGTQCAWSQAGRDFSMPPRPSWPSSDLRDNLKVATFNLTPREPISGNIEQARKVAASTVDVVKTMLYARTGEKAAAAEGRRLWYDPNTLTLTITDTQDNIRTVSDYIRSLGTMGAKTRSEIVPLRHQTASEAASFLNQTLGLTSPQGAGAGTGAGGGGAQASITRTIRTATGSGGGSDITFRDINVRLVNVEQNDVTDPNDDSVELVVRTPTSSEDRTITKFRSDYVDDYEIYVEDIRPSGTPGQGNARIQIRYNPQL